MTKIYCTQDNFKASIFAQKPHPHLLLQAKYICPAALLHALTHSIFRLTQKSASASPLAIILSVAIYLASFIIKLRMIIF
jgi:hypothetical protein